MINDLFFIYNTLTLVNTFNIYEEFDPFLEYNLSFTDLIFLNFSRD